MNTYKKAIISSFIFLSGCANTRHLKTEIITPVCIKPLFGYHYQVCHEIIFKINDHEFHVPKDFDTDLASIPRIAWSIMSPSHSSLIRPAIVHDWLYRKTCDFSRRQTDLILYHMLINDGVSHFRATIMYYAVRTFGWNYYNEEYCDKKLKRLDQETRGHKFASLFRYKKNDINY